MLSASAKPNAARVCAGSAFSPKAAAEGQSGRHPRPSERPAAQIDAQRGEHALQDLSGIEVG